MGQKGNRIPVSSWDGVRKNEFCVYFRNRPVYMTLIQPENLRGSYGGVLAQTHSWSRGKLTPRWLSSNEPRCSMSNSLQCIYTFFFPEWFWMMFYLPMCKNIQKKEKEKKIQMEEKNEPEVVQGLYLCIKPLKRKSAALRWVLLVARMSKIIHGWAWYIQTLDYRSVRFVLHMCTKF